MDKKRCFQSDLKKRAFPQNVDIYVDMVYSELGGIQKFRSVVVGGHESIKVNTGRSAFVVSRFCLKSLQL